MARDLFLAGLLAVKGYVATHVLTCLVPAFLLAGAMVTFVDRELVLHYLGRKAGRIRSYSLAAGGSFLIAACSCTVIPVAGGLFYAGAGISAAFILLWVAPSANILSLVYTGQVLGAGIVASRVVASLAMAFLVGIAMDLAFGNNAPGAEGHPHQEGASPVVPGKALVLILLILLSLLLPNYLIAGRPYPYKVAVWLFCTVVLAGYAWWMIPPEKIRDWARETWWFVRIIFPLLLIGVFLVGIVGNVLPEEWIREWLGGNGIRASFLATLVGAVTYFATMTEAPFVHTLMGLGMGKGPALALLLTGPGVSLPNWLAIARVFGVKKAFVYVPVIIVSGTLAGWFFGNFVL
jgi:uncharacterized membrane protein YraQ (UPF0718 family)